MAEVKICGLSSPETVTAAVESGARFVGFVFFPPSPRDVAPARATALAAQVPPGVAKVGLFVDPDDAQLDTVLASVPLDFLQIHKVGDPQRLRAIRDRCGLPLIVAQAVAEAADVDRGIALAPYGDMLMFDAKPKPGAPLPGGNGVAFDWRLLANRRFPRPWMLAGGLTPETVSAAVALTGAKIVDVSSGVEIAPGAKDADRIRAFVQAARRETAPT